MRVINCILGIILISGNMVFAADFNLYFSNSTGNDSGNDCTNINNPCKTLANAETMANSGSSGDIINLHFKGGDTWTCDTANLNGGSCFRVNRGEAAVTITSYGTGRAVFDGMTSDFPSAPDPWTGRARHWSNIFEFRSKNGTIDNIEIKNSYGRVISLNGCDWDSNASACRCAARDCADGFTLTNSLIHNFGGTGIQTDFRPGIENTTVTYNIFHTGEQLTRFGKKSGWGAAIGLIASGYGANSMCKNNIVKHNIVYDIYGEGIQCTNSLCEYNIVGDTYSTALNTSSHDYDSLDTTIRYNFVIGSSSNIYGKSKCTRVYDELAGGDNSAADIKIYGNICINRTYGFKCFCNEDCGNPFGSIKVYNNLVIDSPKWHNFYIADTDEVINGQFYNNVAIHYERLNVAHTNNPPSKGGWTFSNNVFWPVDADDTVGTIFKGAGGTDFIVADPHLPGEDIYQIDWSPATGLNYFTKIKFTDVSPPDFSPLVDNGKTLGAGFENKFLTTGTDWKPDPAASTWQLASQDSNWDIGAIIYNGDPVNTAPIVNAGTDQTITLPANTANLDGTVSDDNLPDPPGAVTTTWTKQSGPGTVTFGNSRAVDTTASFSDAGTYVLRLTADDSDLQTNDDVTITVNGDTTAPDAPTGLIIIE